MELNAYTKTIRTVFSTNVKYIVPRFQREYSWGKEEVSELWNDIIYNIIVTEDQLTNNEYFIGSLVLIGEDRSTSLQIVDGQQRLTTITIVLSALVQSLRDLSQDNLANAVYNTYIEGIDEENIPFFKLINENPRPFLQTAIQHIDKTQTTPNTKEEKSLWDAYTFFYEKLKKQNLTRDFRNWAAIPGDEDSKYLEVLKKIRDQILSYLKVIYITVANEDDAYMIFETLNARGKNLSAVDLVKNELFKKLQTTHPDDTAKRTWKAIQRNLSEREQKINIETFLRHLWLSKYNFVTESKIFKNFKTLSTAENFSAIDFLNDLSAESSTYNKIANPVEADWPRQEDRQISTSLKALYLFQITQTRMLLMAMLKQRDNRLLAHADFINFIKQMENFHFKYTAICSLKMNIFEGKYSKAARDLRRATTTTQSRDILNQVLQYYSQKEPDIILFKENFRKLTFTNSITKDKKLILYIFRSIERSLRPTDEVVPGHMTLEHIVSQVTRVPELGQIGNLLPLNGRLNQLADIRSFQEKLVVYNQSDLVTVQNFVAENSLLPDWTVANILQRTDSIAEDAYNRVWKVN